MDNDKNINLFQQIGQIQGSLTGLATSISDFKSEFRSATSDQNKKIEDLRKEFSGELKDLSDKVETLEEFKSNLQGAQSEAQKSARWSGGKAGGTVGVALVIIYEAVKFFINNVSIK